MRIDKFFEWYFEGSFKYYFIVFIFGLILGLNLK